MNETKPRQLKPRKTPIQTRSAKKVEAILEATMEILSTKGLEKLTTINIAKYANLSVGSLYQYFPNKQSVLFELYRRWTGKTNVKIDEFARSITPSDSLDEIVDGLLSALADGGDYTVYPWEAELIKAVSIYPELTEIDEKHAEQFCNTMSDILKSAGLKARKKERLHIARYLYELDSAFWESTTKGVPAPTATRWHNQSIKALLRPYFDQR